MPSLDASSAPARRSSARERLSALHPGGSTVTGQTGAPIGGWVPETRRRRRVPATGPPPRPPSAPPPHRSSGETSAAAPEDEADPVPSEREIDQALPFLAHQEPAGYGPDDPEGTDRADEADGAHGADGADGAELEPPGRPGWAARAVRRGPWGALAERWVPEPLRGARVDPGRRGAVLLSVIAALAAVVAAVGVWWGRPQAQPVAPAALSAAATGASPAPVRTSETEPSGTAPSASAAGVAPASGASGSPASAAETTPTGPILVSVTGKVRHPGLVTVPAGARVADAIAAAGGPLDPDDLTGLNLAAHLSDGDSVVVSARSGATLQAATANTGGAAVGPSTPGGTQAPVDLNSADETQLEELPGVGPVTAAAIIAWRTDHGPFTSIEQLQAVSGIGPATYAKIAPHVTV